MKVKEFIKGEYDIDVYDDMTEELGICAVCPIELTDEGKQFFGDVLEMSIELYEDEAVAVVHVEDEQELRRAKKFFYSAAGYCGEKDYDKWFKE
ncbi:MAG: hypothetical protein IKG83_03160 [Prevotella sp.]|nr:hypothetical protein [Prevotella sp.]